MLPRIADDDVRYPAGRRTYADITAPRGPAELSDRLEELERSLWHTATGRRPDPTDPAFRRVVRVLRRRRPARPIGVRPGRLTRASPPGPGLAISPPAAAWPTEQQRPAAGYHPGVPRSCPLGARPWTIRRTHCPRPTCRLPLTRRRVPRPARRPAGRRRRAHRRRRARRRAATVRFVTVDDRPRRHRRVDAARGLGPARDLIGAPPAGPPRRRPTKPPATHHRGRHRRLARQVRRHPRRPGRRLRRRRPEPEPAPGLGEQVSATREAARRLVEAHVELAKAEFAEIGESAKRAVDLRRHRDRDGDPRRAAPRRRPAAVPRGVDLRLDRLGASCSGSCSWSPRPLRAPCSPSSPRSTPTSADRSPSGSSSGSSSRSSSAAT